MANLAGAKTPPVGPRGPEIHHENGRFVNQGEQQPTNSNRNSLSKRAAVRRLRAAGIKREEANAKQVNNKTPFSITTAEKEPKALSFHPGGSAFQRPGLKGRS